jgi:hypothetical protein
MGFDNVWLPMYVPTFRKNLMNASLLLNVDTCPSKYNP